jgi:hypothetical protein
LTRVSKKVNGKTVLDEREGNDCEEIDTIATPMTIPVAMATIFIVIAALYLPHNRTKVMIPPFCLCPDSNVDSFGVDSPSVRGIPYLFAIYSV